MLRVVTAGFWGIVAACHHGLKAAWRTIRHGGYSRKNRVEFGVTAILNLLPAQTIYVGFRMDDKVSLDFTIISRRLKSLSLPEVDYVVGIATGGIVPASLIAHQLDKPLALMHIQHRAEDNTPIYEPPLLVTSPSLPLEARRILLVDDVCVSGKTMQIAKQALGDRNITTLVMKGAADHVLFPEIAACVNWPWKLTR